jgi:hypothetical protein
MDVVRRYSDVEEQKVCRVMGCDETVAYGLGE